MQGSRAGSSEERGWFASASWLGSRQLVGELLIGGLLMGCGPARDATNVDEARADADVTASSATTLLDLEDVKTNTDAYAWFDFRPNVKKLILAGAEDSQHIAILWYTISDGRVGLHYHAKTESVFVIDGTQTDAKGTYATGTVYFNPPGSGHQISNSTGFFILAYAAPPDFANSAQIGEYSPVRIDTAAPDFRNTQPFVSVGEGVRRLVPPLDEAGGIAAEFIELTAPAASLTFSGNYVLVLEGGCAVDGAALAPGTLSVGTAVQPRSYALAAPATGSCLALGIAFRSAG